MSNHQQRSANAVGGRTARACDGCIRRRARWYCAADDAFLCQACDSSVHSANPLARRHHRLRLTTSSSSPHLKPTTGNSSPSAASAAVVAAEDVPAWHHGFKRKARTPRAKPNARPPAGKVGPLVPDLSEAEAEVGVDSGDEVEQLLYRVPVFDPLLAEFCSPPRMDLELDFQPPIEEVKPPPPAAYADGLAGFHPTDMELAEFAADVESLLGRGLDDVDAFCMEGLGIVESKEEEEEEDSGRVKMEMEGEAMVGVSDHDQCHDMEMETLDINFDCYSPRATLEEAKGEVSERRLSLKLDYDAVVADWSVKGCSPWTDGERLMINLDDCWHDFMGMWGGGREAAAVYGQMTAAAVGDGGREARVTRYREKRRTRLFSKKIRYEVRKLNAEKRPRMKGRFVKRASFPSMAAATNGFPY